jgi:hypothetical protein
MIQRRPPRLIRLRQTDVDDVVRRSLETRAASPAYSGQEDVSIDYDVVTADVQAMVQARHEAGMPVKTHDPDWTPVLIRTSLVMRLVAEVMRRRSGPADVLYPGHVANLAVMTVVQKLEANDPDLDGFLEKLRQIIAKGGAIWNPTGERADPPPRAPTA